MKETVNSYQFHRAFEQVRPDNFSYQGLDILFDYLESLEDDIGQDIELDVIAICCDFSEDTVSDIADNYDIDLSGCINQKVSLSNDVLVSNSFRNEFNNWLLDFFGADPIDDDDITETVINYLQENTSFVGQVDDSEGYTSIVYQSF